MFRVVYCFFSYREVHIALRSIFLDSWLEADYFSLTNFCSICGGQSHIRSFCEEKMTPSSVVSVDVQTMYLSTAL